MTATLRDTLVEIVGSNGVSDDPDDLTTYGRDWTRIHEPRPSLIVFPTSTDHVSRVLCACSDASVAVVPSGGRTGLAAGALARDGEVVLSLERMRRIDPVDEVGRTVRVQAGAITEAVHAHCAEHGLTWPIDFASKGSSQVGGNIATNAGGVRVIRYGLTRQWVLGLQVVLANGDVLDINGALEKNNTGVDLRQLFIGSEGILGVITEATLKLAPLPGPSSVFLFAVEDLAAVVRLFVRATRGPFVVNAFEMFTSACMARLERHRQIAPPIAQASTYVLLEVEAPAVEARDAWLLEVMEDGLVVDGTMAQSGAQARELWTLREGISESLSATGLPHKNDIALPIAALEPFVNALETLLAEDYPQWEVCLFGHIGDGNLHVNVMKPDGMDTSTFVEQTHELDAKMFDLVRAHHGSVSAEHGIGLLKRPWLGHSRSPEEIALMAAMKRVLDPKGTLNPGKVLPPP